MSKEKRPLKTYGARGSQDVFEFRGHSEEEQEVYSNKSMGSDTMSNVSKLQRQSRESEPSAEDRYKKKILNAESESGLGIDVADGGVPLSNKSHHREAGTTAFIDSPMPPPTSRSTLGEYTQQSEVSMISTLPDSTHEQPIQMQDNWSVELLSTDNLMPPPAVFSHCEIESERPPAFSIVSHSHTKSTKRSRLDSESPKSEHRRKYKSTTRNDTDLTSKYSRIEDEHMSAEPLQEQAILADGEDELSLSALTSAISPVKAQRQEIKKVDDGRHVDVDELGSDDITIGLPKEQYQPRPSRSRSGRADASDIFVPVDFSKRPEALLKRKIKRRKTTAFEKPKPKDEEDETDMPEPHSYVSTTSNPVTTTSKLNADVAKSKEAEIIDEAEESQKEKSEAHINPPPPPPEPKKQRGRPKKKAMEITDAFVENPAPQALLSNPSDQEDPQEPTPPPAPQPGRKCKPNQELPTPPIPPKPPFREETLAHFTTISPDPESNHPLESNPPSSPLPKLPETPQKSKLEAKGREKGPDRHSPLTSSKVKYRVGLSRRARIEPLLRIVRK